MTVEQALCIVSGADPIWTDQDIWDAAKLLAVALRRERDEHISDAARIEMLREENARQRAEIARLREIVEAVESDVLRRQLSLGLNQYQWYVVTVDTMRNGSPPYDTLEAAFKQWKEKP